MPRAISGSCAQREDQQLAVLADDGDVVAGGRDADRGRRRRVDVQDALALAGVASDVVRRARRSRARRWSDEELRAGPVGEGGDDVRALVDVDHEADRLAVAAPARAASRRRA